MDDPAPPGMRPTDAARAERGSAPIVAPRRFDTDDRLVAAVRAGSDPAFRMIYERHHAAVRGLCRKMLVSAEDSDDSVQHTFAAAYASMMRTPNPIVLRPWLLTIARHRCLTVIASRSRSNAYALHESVSPAFTPDLDVGEDLRAVLDDIARLPDDQRAALVLRELGGATYEEIAVILQAPAARGRTLVFQARSWLRSSRHAREIPCAQIRGMLASSHGAMLRRSELRHHLRQCEGCRAFAAEQRAQRRGLKSLLPLGPLAALKRATLGSFAASSGGGAALLQGSVAVKVLVIAAVAGGGGAAGLKAAEGPADHSALRTTLAGGAGAIGGEPARASGGGQAARSGIVRPKREAQARPHATHRTEAPSTGVGAPATAHVPAAEAPSAPGAGKPADRGAQGKPFDSADHGKASKPAGQPEPGGGKPATPAPGGGQSPAPQSAGHSVPGQTVAADHGGGVVQTPDLSGVHVPATPGAPVHPGGPPGGPGH
jgi:RNA polymerase sigma factor (sigma-70 family)